MTVAAQAEPRGPMVFTVKQGADFPLSAHRVSARVLAAFASEGRQDAMVQAMIVEDRTPEPSALRKRLSHIARTGYDMAPSETIGGVIDLAFPVFDHDGYAKASLSCRSCPADRANPGFGNPESEEWPKPPSASPRRSEGLLESREEPASGTVQSHDVGRGRAQAWQFILR